MLNRGQQKNGSVTLPLSTSQEFHIRAALNAQTLKQFQAYAAQQHPDDHAKQMKLISQLQDRHFHQYMEYLAQTHLPKSAEESPEANHSTHRHEQLTSADANPAPSAENVTFDEPVSATSQAECPPPQTSATTAHAVVPSRDSDEVHEHSVDDADAPKECVSSEAEHSSNGITLAPARMWTRPDIVEFKALLSQDAESVVNVGSGELVTIRVPVVPSGNCIVWEFATDNYDIGFGLFFEWVKPSSRDASDQASWTIIEGSSQPLDASSPSPDPLNQSQTPCKVVVEEVIPIYRRSSNVEIYCGSHAYPGNGNYLLKFDNTYSLWRSKMLYYRVYSTK
uniref:Golgi resident protein GCP60 n=1 Tax=Schistocephalus solidus TaxID=70667 RepID=A0A0X3QAE4_SCHSO